MRRTSRRLDNIRKRRASRRDIIRKKTLAARPGQDLRRRRAASPRGGVLEAYWRPFTTQEALDGPVADDPIKVDRAVIAYSTLPRNKIISNTSTSFDAHHPQRVVELALDAY